MGRQAGKQASRQAGRQAGRQVCYLLQASYLSPSCSTTPELSTLARGMALVFRELNSAVVSSKYPPTSVLPQIRFLESFLYVSLLPGGETAGRLVARSVRVVQSLTNKI